MFNKKIYILLLLIVSICTISTVSAVDNVTDALTVDDAASDDVVTVFIDDSSNVTDDTNKETKEDVASEDTLAATENDSSVAVVESDEVLSAKKTPASMYTVKFTKDVYQFSAVNGAVIEFNINPCKNTNYNAFNLYVCIFKLDSKNNLVSEVSESETVTNNGKDRNSVTYTYTIDPKEIKPGKYAIYVANDDSKGTFMDAARLEVKKPSVTIKASKFVKRGGTTVKLKATVTSQGKKLTGGYVVFRISGKNYKVKVKNGVATKYMKVKQNKKYVYAARYIANTFYKASKKVTSYAMIRGRIATKILVKPQTVYRGDTSNKAFYAKIVTASGKYVKGGVLKVVGIGEKENVNGKVKLYRNGFDWNYVTKKGNDYYYKKSVTKYIKLIYTPSNKNYKSSVKYLKYTVRYKCPIIVSLYPFIKCGKTYSHAHGSERYHVI